MGCPLVGCSLVKKGVLGAVLGAGALYLAFGTSAPSYVRTAFNGVRSSAKSAVPIEFEIRRAREEVANLEPAIKRNIAEIAQAEVDAKDLADEVAATRNNLASAKAEILTRREKLEAGVRLAGGSDVTVDEMKTDLARRLDSYRSTSKLLENKEASLKAKQKSLTAAGAQLNQMIAAKKQLMAKIDEIESRQKLIQVTKESRDFNFDDSALANVKQTVSELANRLDKEARIAEIEGKYSDGLSITNEAGRDVAKEVDAEFGPAPKKTGDKSL